MEAFELGCGLTFIFVWAMTTAVFCATAAVGDCPPLKLYDLRGRTRLYCALVGLFGIACLYTALFAFVEHA